MPAHLKKKKYRCAGYEEEVQASNTSNRTELQEAIFDIEKESAEFQKRVRKIVRNRKKEWDTTLVFWSPRDDFRFPINTVAMYKSDAKSAYSLTEKEILTLQHESIPYSSKTFFSQADVVALFDKKTEAGAAMPGIKVKNQDFLRAFRKVKPAVGKISRKLKDSSTLIYGASDSDIVEQRCYIVKW